MNQWHLFIAVFMIAIQTIKGFKQKKLPEKLTLHLINLDTKKEKYQKMVELWSEHFNLVRFSARTSKIDPVCGLALSHIDLMREFLETSQDDILLLLEDDAFPTPDFSEKFVRTAIEHALRIPFWHVINFGPWFSKQPKVEPIDDYLVAIDYFHTTHFMGYHRRGIEKYLENFASVIEKGYCLAVDNYFGNYGTAKSQSLILATSKLMAYQNHGGKSDIGGGPEMNPCAINAALAGRRVYVHINEAPRHDIRPTFDPPVFGYKVIDSPTEEIIWSHQCNLEFDEITQAQIDRAETEETPVMSKKAQQQKQPATSEDDESSSERESSTKKKKSNKKKKKEKKSKKALEEFDSL